jgi:lipoprotein signal peptidase
VEGGSGLLVNRFATFELHRFRRRVTLMLVVAASAIVVDLVTKTAAVELWPSTLLFNVSDRMPYGLAGGLAIAAATSVLMCVLPVRLVAVGAGLALGGSLANVASRQWWGELGGTPDFIRFSDGSTGNLADLSIAAGALFMLLSTIAWLAMTTFAPAREPS